MEEPSLIREIGKVAWFMLRIVTGLSAVAVLLAVAFQHNLWLGTVLFCTLILSGQCILTGWMNYKSKKKDLEWRLRDEQRDREWNEAPARRERSA
jgi:hypothetical protein